MNILNILFYTLMSVGWLGFGYFFARCRRMRHDYDIGYDAACQMHKRLWVEIGSMLTDEQKRYIELNQEAIVSQVSVPDEPDQG